MRTGRPAMRAQFKDDILAVLAERPYPATVSSVKRYLDGRRARPCGWDTVRKYLDELVSERLVLRQALPAEPGHKGLVVFMARRADR